MSGGTISGNSALIESGGYGKGGGVYVNGSFTKSGSSIIYGDTDTTHTPGANENTAASGDGHAVYWDGNKQRNATLASGVNLSTSNSSLNWD
jgi:hypothetical protein